MTRNTRIVAAAGLLLFCAGARAADPAYYVRKGAWQETLQAAREALAAFEADQATRAELAGAKPEAGYQLGPFYQIGPFNQPGTSAFEAVFEPEKAVDVTQPCGKLRWQRINDDDGVVHDLTCPGESALYFYRTITATRRMKPMAFFGSDDGLAVWLNGKKLISNKVPRGVSPDQDKARLDLEKGVNHLLIKIWNRGGGCGYYFSMAAGGKGKGKSDPRTARREELWDLVRRDFATPEAARQMRWEQEDAVWLADWPAGDLPALAKRYAAAARGTSAAQDAAALAAKATNQADLARLRAVYYQAKATQEALAKAGELDCKALRLALEDLMQTYGEKYPRGGEYLKRLDEMERLVGAAALRSEASGSKTGGEAGKVDQARLVGLVQEFLKLRREILLSNPLLNFDKLLVVKRSMRQLGLPQNWQGNCALKRDGYDNEIAVLSPVSPEGRLTTLYRPEGGQFVGDVDLHFDGRKMIFSSLDADKRWQIYELGADGKDLRQVTPSADKDVDNYDPLYLPDERIIFGSTRCFLGVPCVGGSNSVANLYIMNAERDPNSVRQLTFEQDHDWCPTLMHDGRVMYTRWEYSDAPHYFTRILFSMNPDGTQQMELYGSNSYWPNSIFYTRPCPGHATKIVSVISGHHGVPRMGEMIVFDPAKGRHEADGVVQRIPGYGKVVEPLIRDGLVDGSWPKFLHPWPLSDKYFLVSCQKTARDDWDLYLVDVFDNMVKLCSVPGCAIFEPVPLRSSPRPPVIPDKVDLARKDAVIYMTDVYSGDGLKGVPRGTVKKLRVYAFHYAYFRMGGHINIGVDGPWDVHRILGTVPVNPDGSAMFRVPANTPIAVQPLDEDGKALQVMRSWLTAMPGEFLSCVGCHEKQSVTAQTRHNLATGRKPDDITPWYGPARGFSFKREVQPVLDKYCVTCHDGAKTSHAGLPLPDFRRSDKKGPRGFTPSYLALHPFVRRPGPESDYHLMSPLEYHADMSELTQMLRKGHGRVTLDAEAWDRLITWMDLNVPDHGTWSEHRAISGDIHDRRLAMAKAYAGISTDPEKILDTKEGAIEPVQPGPPPVKPAAHVTAAGWPFDAAEAKRRQQAAGEKTELAVELGGGVRLDLVLIPAGEFVMGDLNGWPDEWPLARVRIEQPFWMGKVEVTNEQYAAYDATHDSAYISVYNKDQSTRGEIAHRTTQPVIRVSWKDAMGFCRWLSDKTGARFSLPTEAQWEYACRAGTATPLYWGDCATDFGKLANLADERVNNLTRRDSTRWIPGVNAVNDGAIVTENVGKYDPNPWGLYDMHGNVFEWTATTFKPYPYNPADGRDNLLPEGRKVVRGGSFYDRPKRARSAFRLDYPSWQKVYSVGFRVVCAADAQALAAAKLAKADK